MWRPSSFWTPSHAREAHVSHHETWIYHPTEGGKVVTLGVRAPAPEGWSYDPSVIVDEAARTAEALSGVRLPIVAEASEADVPPDGFEEALRSAIDRIGELEAIITSGLADNQALDVEVKRAEDELDEAAQAIMDAQTAHKAAEDRADALAAQVATFQAELERNKGENAKLHEDVGRYDDRVKTLADEVERLKARLASRNR